MTRQIVNSDNITRILHQRVSFPRLVDPAPSGNVLKNILSVAFRAPDHKILKPARYLLIEGDARHTLGETFAQAALGKEEGVSEAKLNKCRNMPLRAPLILVAISKNIVHPKVPIFEQEQAVAVGLGYILLALQAEGFGGIWRTGDMAVNPRVLSDLGVDSHESLVGFLYIGTPDGEPKRITPTEFEDHFSYWNGP